MASSIAPAALSSSGCRVAAPAWSVARTLTPLVLCVLRRGRLSIILPPHPCLPALSTGLLFGGVSGERMTKCPHLTHSDSPVP